jgi:hypothetical protein
MVIGITKNVITEVAYHSDYHSRNEVIPFPRITSSVNAGFPVLSALSRQNELAASKSHYVFSLPFSNIIKA